MEHVNPDYSEETAQETAGGIPLPVEQQPHIESPLVERSVDIKNEHIALPSSTQQDAPVISQAETSPNEIGTLSTLEQHKQEPSLPEGTARPQPAPRSNSWEVIDEYEQEGRADSGAETPKAKYAVLPGTPGDISPPELLMVEHETQLPEFVEEETEREPTSDIHTEEDRMKEEMERSVVPTVVEKLRDEVKHDEFEDEEEQKPRTPEERAQAVEDDLEFIAYATAAAEFSGFDSNLVLSHRVPVHRGLAYQPSMEEIADEEQGGVIPVEKQEQASPVFDWTASTPTRETPTRSSTYRDAVDEFPALSRWQKKSSMITQQQQQEQEQQRRNAEIRRQRLISYPSNSTMASTAASDYTVTDGGSQSYNWDMDEPITSSQSVSRRNSIADTNAREHIEEAMNSGQITPSDLTPTPSTIGPASTFLDNYISSHRAPKDAATQPAPESTWGGDSGLGDEIASRLSGSTIGSSGSWEPTRSMRKRRETFDSTYGREHELQRSALYDSTETLTMSADDSEIPDARKERRMRRKQEREAPLALGSLLTREETIDALQNRPKSAFEEKIKMFDKPDGKEIFPLPQGVKTRSTSPTHDLTVRRALFDQPPIPIAPSESAFQGLKRSTTWGPGRKNSSPELSTAAATSFAPPARAATISPDPVKSKTPYTSPPRASGASPPLSPPSPPPADIDEIDDDEQSSEVASPPSSDPVSTTSTMSRASQLDFGSIPKRIPADANSWGRKLGKYFRPPSIGMLEKPPRSPGEQSQIDEDLDIDGTQEVNEDDDKKQKMPGPTLSRSASFLPAEEPIPEEPEHTAVEPLVDQTPSSFALNQLFSPPETVQPTVTTTTAALSPLSPQMTLGTPMSTDGSASWSDYFAGVRKRVVEVGGTAAAKAAEALADIASPTTEQRATTGSVNRDLASESAEFAGALEAQYKASQVPLPETPAPAPTRPAWRDVQGEARDVVKIVEESKVQEAEKPQEAVIVPTKAVVEEEDDEEEVAAPLQFIDEIDEEQEEEDDDDEDEEERARKEAIERVMASGVILDTILEESEPEYEYYDELTGKVYDVSSDQRRLDHGKVTNGICGRHRLILLQKRKGLLSRTLQASRSRLIL